MPQSKSSQRWLKEHFNDPYVRKAQQAGYRSRAAYKLIEIQQRDRLFKKGMVVVDLGAAPGGWSQMIAQWVGSQGLVISLDLLPMAPLEHVTFIQGDFRETEVFEHLQTVLADKPVDCVVSDMAPNTSGMRSVDQPKMIYLAELALDFALQTLKPGGIFLIKVFQGEDFESFLKTVRQSFQQVFIRKPDASRKRSTEVYIVAKKRLR